MKKLLGLATTLVMVAGTAQAVPTIKLEYVQAGATTCGTLSDVSPFPVVSAGTSNGVDTCSFTRTDGYINTIGAFGTWTLNNSTLKSDPAQDQPAFWFDSVNTTTVAGTLTIMGTVSGYSDPIARPSCIASSGWTTNSATPRPWISISTRVTRALLERAF